MLARPRSAIRRDYIILFDLAASGVPPLSGSANAPDNSTIPFLRPAKRQARTRPPLDKGGVGEESMSNNLIHSPF